MLGNTLSAAELLRSKGIRFERWENWERTSETLPSKGKKQFKPNDSWLQRKQIEEGLKTRKNLLAVERVERSSQLASAEWLSHESRALVTKKSGQEWTSFGTEENSKLYLTSEEALLLVELNCLELTWRGMALSVQQAYAVLLESDRSDCSLEEYRVYSHLARQGYRLQRFRFEGDGETRRDGAFLKRKRGTVVQDLRSVFRINDDVKKLRGVKKPRLCGEWFANATGSEATNTGDKKPASEVYDNGAVNLPGPSNAYGGGGETTKKTGKVSKVQIISDETVSTNLRIARPSLLMQKNVGRDVTLGRNTDETSSATDKRETGAVEKVGEKSATRHEVIEISDDEIEVLPRKLSRMELLNLIPNLISESYTFEPISKKYLPKNVRPQTPAEKLSRWKTRGRYPNRVDESLPRLRENCAPSFVGAPPVVNMGAMLLPRGNRMPWLAPSIPHGTFFSSWSYRSSNGFHRGQSRVDSLVYGGGQSVNHNALYNQRSILSDPSCFYWRQSPAWGRNYQSLQRGSSNDYEGSSKSSFKAVRGAESWSETKETWLKDKTIRLDDDDDDDDDEYEAPTIEEVEVVMQPPKPLVGSANAKNLSQVYERLRIIKEAPSGAAKRPKRRRAIDYRISYNLYPAGQPYKKTNPGAPLYRIVVFRLEDTPFIEPADIAQLRLDAKETPVVLACVSRTSVTFAEFGQVVIPNIQIVQT